MSSTAPPSPPRAALDKRGAILAAARRLIASDGLHGTPMSALAREAGVAAGTLYLYFPSKEALINALYLQLLRDRDGAVAAGTPGEPPEEEGRARMWRAWYGLARWHLDHPEASSVIQQCRAAGILTDETRDEEQRMQSEGLALFDDAVSSGQLRALSRQVFYALFAGPIFVLAQMRDAGEIEVTEELLRATFDGVCRSVLPEGA